MDYSRIIYMFKMFSHLHVRLQFLRAAGVFLTYSMYLLKKKITKVYKA